MAAVIKTVCLAAHLDSVSTVSESASVSTSVLTPGSVNFGCLNMRSFNSKFDDVIELLANHYLSD